MDSVIGAIGIQYDGLFPEHVEKTLPPLYSNENKTPKDTMVQVKFFNAGGMGTWYATEYDAESKMFFGWVDLGCPELGYFSLEELQSYIGPLGLGIERDILFSPRPLSEIKVMYD